MAERGTCPFQRNASKLQISPHPRTRDVPALHDFDGKTVKSARFYLNNQKSMVPKSKISPLSGTISPKIKAFFAVSSLPSRLAPSPEPPTDPLFSGWRRKKEEA
ncbi:MAG: hypothetical protein KBT02_01080 [Treponema sp.]|nr:hypothetical protein [Candidatus Treponema caballi]